MSIVRDFEMAFNRQDVTALVACFTPTGRYRDTFFGEHIGHAALRAMFERMFHERRDYASTMEHVVEDDRRAAAGWTFSYVVRNAVPPRATGVVAQRARLPPRQLRDERLRPYPLPPAGDSPVHPGLRPGGVGAEVRLPRPAARARAGGRRGRARQHGGAPPAPPRGGVGARGPAHGVGALHGRGLARDLRRPPRGPRPADRDERRAVAGGAAPLMHRRGPRRPPPSHPQEGLRGQARARTAVTPTRR